MRCPNCRGNKKVQGLGWMEGDCMRCDGTGSVGDVVMGLARDDSNGIEITDGIGLADNVSCGTTEAKKSIDFEALRASKKGK